MAGINVTAPIGTVNRRLRGDSPCLQTMARIIKPGTSLLTILMITDKLYGNIHVKFSLSHRHEPK